MSGSYIGGLGRTEKRVVQKVNNCAGPCDQKKHGIQATEIKLISEEQREQCGELMQDGPVEVVRS